MPSPPRWTPLVLPQPVRTIAAHGPHAVAALDDGRVLCSDDGGTTWRRAVAGSIVGTTTLLSSRDTLLAGTQEGIVRAVRLDGWRPARGGPEHVVVTALAARGTATIAGTARTGVWRSSDGGARWSAATEGLPLGGRCLRVHAATDSVHGLVVAHALGVSWSEDDGASWSSAGVGLPLQVPHATLATDGVALYAGVEGRLYRAEAPEVHADLLRWTEIHDGPGLGLPLDLLAADRDVLYAAAPEAPYLAISSDAGTHWHPVSEGLPGPPVGLIVARPWLLAVLPDGRLWRLRRLRPPAGDLPLILDLQADDEVVSFSLLTAAVIHLTLHDPLGADVADLAHGRFPAGAHRLPLPPGLPAGLYRCRLRAGTATRAVSLALLR